MGWIPISVRIKIRLVVVSSEFGTCGDQLPPCHDNNAIYTFTRINALFDSTVVILVLSL